MIPLSLASAALATEGRLSGGADPDRLITGPLVFDSRDITPGSLFCCLAGKSVDGHDFTAQAVAAGAVAVLAANPVDAPAIVVPDVLGAMGQIAARVASEFTGTVIGLTGSAGKTSTKDLLTSILELDGPTVATPRSFNNELGFPVTVSRVETGSRYLLLEMGARGLGHIDSLCDIARPTISTVLGVGSAHIGEFGSREVTAQAKAEIVRALPAHGTAVLNGDDPLVSAMAGATDAAVITFGFGEHCDIRAEQVGVQHDGRPHFVLVHGKDRRRIELRVHGRHNVLNALAAAATAVAAGIPADRIAQGLRQAEISSGGRMEVTTREDGVTVINDAFNASPESVLAALAALGDIAGPTRRKVAVLGEMAELGDEAAAWHDQVAEHVVRLRPAEVLGIGSTHMERMLMVMTDAGLKASRSNVDPEVPLIEEIRRVLRPGDVVLIKGANSLGLEAVARELAAVPTS
ncbi:UDP-N-acetylmuramoyl-tripeptide--D-alanyl-D-alanine ligase [Streptomyces sp. G-G2]|uniref:UDP-N-acetylmuramoyl-tripeptide--D-alanyl-D- alanine ligase n=1 Tax=Streptomyces sp. G-G2 TaxID=3046201 RepID=UPI0024B93688|nr:UDP-N-acetylmuramoyl-tripeptide--D-alanyl-D-alanine ligase [Streptomyces sp. G-G2]MDJ0383160.1 UDP-N-acetylmuramoyl-tripeptide--D-alanyl-D-alanine ligase [Streptomyces sp. G-G2]